MGASGGLGAQRNSLLVATGPSGRLHARTPAELEAPVRRGSRELAPSLAPIQAAQAALPSLTPIQAAQAALPSLAPIQAAQAALPSLAPVQAAQAAEAEKEE